MWHNGDGSWGFAMLLYMLAVWAAVVITLWAVFHSYNGPRHHSRS